MKIDASGPINWNLQASDRASIEKPSPALSSLLSEKVGETNHQLLEADKALQELASGKAVSLHQTMLTMEEAKLSFQFLEQIRNRLMSAYQDILREQI